MDRPQAFEYLIIWHPTPDQAKGGKKSEVIAGPKLILAKNLEAASMAAAMEIPTDKKDELDQVQVVIRPF
ncbi:MAG TPA: hypothetical protein PLP63_06805 [Saprospiraceae bacterium]|nr:hypothetical protein [Saprospiraceae bacterium]